MGRSCACGGMPRCGRRRAMAARCPKLRRTLRCAAECVASSPWARRLLSTRVWSVPCRAVGPELSRSSSGSLDPLDVRGLGQTATRAECVGCRCCRVAVLRGPTSHVDQSGVVGAPLTASSDVHGGVSTRPYRGGDRDCWVPGSAQREWLSSRSARPILPAGWPRFSSSTTSAT